MAKLNSGTLRLVCLWLAMGVLIASCASGGGGYAPAPAPGYKVGKPYKINGKRYTPRHEPDYDRVGIASWYGDQFHGRPTANGERFNMHALTAAHPTLTLPAEVQVTNLENNRSLILRVNDRGPFAHGRIIDVSRAAAERLGFLHKGTARVRVRYLGLAALDVNGRYAALERAGASAFSAPPAPVEPVSLDEIARQEARNFSDPRPTVTGPAGPGSAPVPQTKPAQFRPAATPISTAAIAADDASAGYTADAPRPSILPAGPVRAPDGGAHDGQILFVSDVYLDALDAEIARQDMAAFGQVSIEAKSDGNLGDYFVVKLGPFVSQTQATAALNRLRAEGYSGAILTMK